MNYDINQRVKEIRNTMSLTQSQFGAELGQSKDVIVNIELNRNKKDINPNFLSHICKTFDVNETWLCTGEGEMFNPSVALTNDIQKEHNLSPQAATILQNFLELSKSDQDKFIELAEKIFNNKEQNDNIILYKDISQNETQIFAADSSSPDTDSLIFHKQNK